jgi:NADPH:quinone reductase-like Zn-dependent oxidoreductase
MRVFQIEGEWGMDHLQVSTRPEPKAGPGQVVLKMLASSLNYRDLLVPDRGYGSHTGSLPLVPVSDGVGVVTEIGPGVKRVAVGDRVCPTYFQRWISGEPDLERLTQSLGGPIDGTMSEYMCVSEDGVAKVPGYLTDVEAACLPCAGLTAWSALVSCTNTKPGDHVLVQGCGGVALFAVAFAKMLGAHVTVISSSDDRIERVKNLGADAAVNYRAVPEWAKATREITGGRGYDLIVELGGEKTLPQSLRCVRPGGTVAMIGVLSGGAMSASLGLVVTRQVRLQGVTVGHRDGFEAMVRAMAQHQIRPVVDRVFGFESLKEAMAYLKSGAQFGKVCLAH